MNGATDDDGKTIPSFMARDLNQGNPHLPAYLINFGEPSFNSLMEAKYLEKAMIEQPQLPDIIIFYDGANDCTYFAQDRTSYAHLGYRRLKGLIESYHHSFFGILKPVYAAVYASYTDELYDKIRQGVIPLKADDPQLLKFVNSVEKRYDYINKVTQVCGIRFRVVLVALLVGRERLCCACGQAEGKRHFAQAYGHTPQLRGHRSGHS